MSVKTFFDTYILIYPLQELNSDKVEKARLILASVPKGYAVISYQVVQEYVNVCLRRVSPTPRAERLRSFVLGLYENYEIVHWSPMLVPFALELHYRYHLQWYDSLIIGTALQAGCEVLYSEDMQHGQRIEGLQVINPFV